MQRLFFTHNLRTGSRSLRSIINICGDSFHNNTLIINHGAKAKRLLLQGYIEIYRYQRHMMTTYFVRNPYDQLRSCYTHAFNANKPSSIKVQKKL